MKYLFGTLVMLLMASCGSKPEQYVKVGVALMDRMALYAEGPEWESARQEALEAVPANMDEAQDVVRKALKVAGGKHSFIMPASHVAQNDTAVCVMPVVTTGDEGIAIIQLPEFAGNKAEGQRYVSTVLDAMSNDITAAIIDLRGNTGGNMYPMIASVHRFIDDGDHMLRFRGRKKTQQIPLSYVLRMQGIDEQPHITCPVALLTDSMTASSGEALLICFRGQANTRTFGCGTAGYASANAPFPLPGGSRLLITTSCDVSRTGEEFCDDPILPDVLTPHPMEDALEWIRLVRSSM